LHEIALEINDASLVSHQSEMSTNKITAYDTHGDTYFHFGKKGLSIPTTNYMSVSSIIRLTTKMNAWMNSNPRDLKVVLVARERHSYLEIIRAYILYIACCAKLKVSSRPLGRMENGWIL
jgi:hypothetical protein